MKTNSEILKNILFFHQATICSQVRHYRLQESDAVSALSFPSLAKLAEENTSSLLT